MSRECVPGVPQRAERNRWTVRRSCRHAGRSRGQRACVKRSHHGCAAPGMSPLLLSEIDHVAIRELGRAAALSAVDDIRHCVRRGRAVLSEINLVTHGMPRMRGDSGSLAHAGRQLLQRYQRQRGVGCRRPRLEKTATASAAGKSERRSDSSARPCCPWRLGTSSHLLCSIDARPCQRHEHVRGDGCGRNRVGLTPGGVHRGGRTVPGT